MITKATTGTAIMPASIHTNLRQAYRFCLGIHRRMAEEPDKEIEPDVRAEFRAKRPLISAHIATVIALLQRQEPVSESLTTKQTVGKTLGAVMQEATAQVLRGLMKKPILDGRKPCDRELVLIAIPQGSVIDMVGGDFLVVDNRSGRFVMLDCSCREKGSDGLCRLRQQGVVFDPMFAHNLRQHGIGSALYSLEKVIHGRFARICNQVDTSPLNVIDLRLPMTSLAGSLDDMIQMVIATSDEIVRRERAQRLHARIAAAYEALSVFVTDMAAHCQTVFAEGRIEDSHLIAELANQIVTGQSIVNAEPDTENAGIAAYLANKLAYMSNFVETQARYARLHKLRQLRTATKEKTA